MIPALLLLAPALLGEPAATGEQTSICWVAPKRISAAHKKQLGVAMVAASDTSRPAHAKGVQLREVPSKAGESRCRAIVAVDLAAGSKAKSKEVTLEISVLDAGATTTLASTSAKVVLGSVRGADLEGAWSAIWTAAAPPPPPPAPPPKTFDDPELKAEKAAPEIKAERSAPAEREPRGPSGFAIFFDLGMLSRDTGDAPGAPIEGATLLSLGVDARLEIHHLAKLGAMSPHEIDVEAGYLRRLARGTSAGSEIGIDADRISASGAYRYRVLEKRGLAAGVLAGWELLRYEIDPAAGAFSARYGVLRVGPSLRSDVLSDPGMRLTLLLDGAVRLVPGADGGDAGAGFDLGGGAELSLGGFLLALRARYAQHAATVLGTELSDSFIDLGIAVGYAP